MYASCNHCSKAFVALVTPDHDASILVVTKQVQTSRVSDFRRDTVFTYTDWHATQVWQHPRDICTLTCYCELDECMHNSLYHPVSNDSRLWLISHSPSPSV